MGNKQKTYSLWGVRQSKFQELGTYSSLAKLKGAWKDASADINTGSLEARMLVDGVSSVINDHMPAKALTEFRSAKERDDHIIENAKYFTIVRFHGVGKYERHERKTREEAEHLAKLLSSENRGNYMIYAVGPHDLSAFVGSHIFKR